MGKRINGCQKGKRGERTAAAYLNSLGFNAERSARNGVKGCHDLIVHDLPNVSIECKYGVQGLDIGTKAMEDVIGQAIADSCIKYGGTSEATSVVVREARAWAVIWQPSRKCWRLTYFAHPCGIVTQTGDVNIKAALTRLNRGE